MFQKKLLLSYISILIISFLLFSGILYFRFESTLKHQVIDSMVDATVQMKINLVQFAEQIENTLFNVSINAKIQQYLSNNEKKETYQAIQESQEIVTEILGLYALSKATSGIYIFSEKQDLYPVYTQYNMSTSAGYNKQNAVFRSNEIKNEIWYRDTVNAEGKYLWIGPAEDSIRGRSDISLNKAILNTKKIGEVLGIVRIFVPLQAFSNLLDKISVGINGYVFLEMDGKIINCTEDSICDGLSSDIFSGVKSIQNLKINHENFIVNIENTDISNWRLINIMPEKAILERINFIRDIIFPAAIYISIVMILAVWFVSTRISRPISYMASVMEHYNSESVEHLPENLDGEVGGLYKSYNRLLDRIDGLISENEKSAEMQRRAELNALQAQINPHFLYNTLSSIANLAAFHNNKEIMTLSTALSDFFRMSLNKGQEKISLKKELEQVENYALIQQYRFKTKFSMEIDVPENFMDYEIIKLIIQPLVENSLIHGFSSLDYPGRIEISANEDGKFFRIFVRDNGIGEDIEYINGILSGEYINESNSNSGYGIRNVNERIKLCFGSDSELSYIENRGQSGITAIIKIERSKIRRSIDEH